MVHAGSRRTSRNALVLLFYLATTTLLLLPSICLSAPITPKKRATLGFSQRAVSSRHGEQFKARNKRRSYDLEKRQSSSDNEAPLYNLEDARWVFGFSCMILCRSPFSLQLRYPILPVDLRILLTLGNYSFSL